MGRAYRKEVTVEMKTAMFAKRHSGKTMWVTKAMKTLKEENPDIRIRYVSGSQRLAMAVMDYMGEDAVGIDFLGIKANNTEPFDVVFLDDVVTIRHLCEKTEMDVLEKIGACNAKQVFFVGTEPDGGSTVYEHIRNSKDWLCLPMLAG